MHRVNVLSPQHEHVQRMLEMMFSLQPLVAPAAILFGGNRWSVVEAVAILAVNGADAGMATLAPTDELGSGGPTIIALWIDPELKAHPNYLIYGVALLKEIVGEALRRYGSPPRFPAVTVTERELASEAERQGIQFTWKDLGGSIAPLW